MGEQELLSNRDLKKIFRSIDISSDLGRKFSERARPFVYTQARIDRVEMYVNRDRHESVDKACQSSNEESISTSKGNTSFATESQSSDRFYKFPGCRRCKLYLHKEMRTHKTLWHK